MPDGSRDASSAKIEDILEKLPGSDEAIDAFCFFEKPKGTAVIYVDQLGATEDEVRKSIADAKVSDAAFVEALIEAWKVGCNTEGSKTTETGTPDDPKPLGKNDPPPAGKVDITTTDWPKLKATQDLDSVTFTIPPLLQINPGPDKPHVQWTDLAWTDWLHVARICNLTKALDVRGFTPNGADGKTVSVLPELAAFGWRAKPGSGFADTVTAADMNDGGLSTRIAFTYEQDAVFKQGIIDASLQVQWVVSASASANHKATLAMNSSKRKIYMTWLDMHPFCRLHLRLCLEPSDELNNRVKEAIMEVSPEVQFDTLLRVVEEFGHVVPVTVILGGYYSFENSRLVSQWDKTKETQLTAQLKVNYASADQEVAKSPDKSGTNSGGGGGASFSYADADKNWMDQGALEESMSSYPVGGNEQLRNPIAWMPTIVNAGDWRVIRREGHQSIFNLLSEDVATKVGQIWSAGCNGAWGIGAARVKNVLPNADYFPVPLFWTRGSIPKLTLRNHSGPHPVLQAKNGVPPTTPQHDPKVIPKLEYSTGFFSSHQTIPEQRWSITPTEIPGGGRTSGSAFTHLDPAPLRLAEAAAIDPKESNALWSLEFSGDCYRNYEGINEPIYWLVSQDSLWLMAGFSDTTPPKDGTLPANGSWAGLLPAVDHATTLPGSSTAAWLLYPADPTGMRGVEFRQSYLIWNPVLKSFLGGEVTIDGNVCWTLPEHDETSIGTLTSGSKLPTGGFVPKITHYAQQTIQDPRVTVLRTSLVPGDVRSVYDLDDDTFINLCWRLDHFEQSSTLPA